MRFPGELWKLSGIFYQELSFKSLLDMRRPNASELTVRRILSKSNTSMIMNKIFLSLVFLLSGIYAVSENTIISYSTYFLMLTFMFSLFFLQSVTYFFQVNFDLLKTLPITRKNRERVIFLTFIRIFDIPLVTNIVAVPLVVLLGPGAFAAMASALGVLIAEAFSILIVTYFSRLFYQKLASPTRGWKSAMRFVFIVIWGTAFFMLYAIMMWMPIILHMLRKYNYYMHEYKFALMMLFPFNVSYLMLSPDIFSLVSTIFFLLLGYLSIRWVMRVIGERVAISYDYEKYMEIKVRKPVAAMVLKDFRLTTRNPGLAMLLLLPVFEAVLLESMNVTGLGLMGVLVTFTIIYLYSVYGYENRELLRVLPVSKFETYFEKSILAFFVYFITLIISLVYSFMRGSPLNYLHYALLTMGIFASCMLVMYMGDTLGLRPSAGMSALGFLVLILVANTISLIPIVLIMLLPGSSGVFISLGLATFLLVVIWYLVKKLSDRKS